MSVVIQAYIGLGSNLGDRVENLIAARNGLSRLPFVSSLQTSSLYVSSPVGYAKQPNFINCALKLEVNTDALSLFDEMQGIETALGRMRNSNNRNAPRIIDIDLLLFGDAQIDNDRLTVPHPRIAERLFVLLPLAELNPSLPIHNAGSVSEIIEQGRAAQRFKQQIVHKLG